jgi:mono/diheme cytochrome c family protein
MTRRHPIAVPLLLALAGVGCQQPAPSRESASPGPGPGPVERGKYLVWTGGCNDCHTPKKMGAQGVPELDTARLLSGHPEEPKLPPPPALPPGPWLALFSWDLTAAAGPWGVSYAVNLTPDENTGIGIWTEEMFVKAMRTGKHMGTSRPILPPMPWETIKNYTDEDLKAIFAYLRSIPPVKNRVPEPIIAPPPAAAAAQP